MNKVMKKLNSNDTSKKAIQQFNNIFYGELELLEISMFDANVARSTGHYLSAVTIRVLFKTNVELKIQPLELELIHQI